MEEEKEYVNFLQKQSISMKELKKQSIIFNFQKQISDIMKRRLRILKNPAQEDDEKFEALIYLRVFIKDHLAQNNKLLSAANAANRSSIQAYAHHPHSLNEIFNLKKINLTNFVNSPTYTLSRPEHSEYTVE